MPRAESLLLVLDCNWRRKYRLYKGQFDGGGRGDVVFFWFVCLELIGREGWGVEMFGGLFVLVGWLGFVFSACYCRNMFMKLMYAGK